MSTYKIYTNLTRQEQQAIARGNTVVCADKLRTFSPGTSNFTIIKDGEPDPAFDKMYPKTETISTNGCGPKRDQYIHSPTMILSARVKYDDKPMPIGKRGKVSQASKTASTSAPSVIFLQDYLNPETMKLTPESEEIEQEAYRRLSSFEALKHTLDISNRYACQAVDLTNSDIQNTLQYIYNEKRIAIPKEMDDAFKESPKFSTALQNIKNNGQISTVISLGDFCKECQHAFVSFQEANPKVSAQALMGKALQFAATEWEEKCKADYNPDAKLFASIAQTGDAIARDAMTDYSTIVVISPAVIPETEVENPGLD